MVNSVIINQKRKKGNFFNYLPSHSEFPRALAYRGAKIAYFKLYKCRKCVRACSTPVHYYSKGRLYQFLTFAHILSNPMTCAKRHQLIFPRTTLKWVKF